MKKVIYLIVLLFFCKDSSAQYSIDTMSSVYVGPGVIHTKILVPEYPWAVNIIEVDLTNPFIQLESVKAKDKLLGYEAVSSMAARNNFEGHQVVAAINGDFYGGGGVPTNTQVIKGEVLKGPINREIAGFDFNKKPLIDIVQYSGSVIHGSVVNSISDVNAARGNDELVLYNSYKGTVTGTNSYGTEVSVEAIDTWYVNDTVRAIVKAKAADIGNMQIDSPRVVLSAHGASRTFLDNMNVGDTIKIVNRLLPGLNKLKEAVGGSERIILHGVNVGGWPERHPRTAVGFSKDSTKLYLIVVDGRTVVSTGVTLTEFGDLMLKLGNIYEAINLDGGGSSTMVVRGNVENYPSDGPGSERLVSNGLMVISSAPTGTLSGINILPKVKRIFRKDKAVFSVSGYDEYYNPAEVDNSKIEFSADENIGTITNDGTFTAAGKAATGYIHVTHGSFSDSALIVVKDIKSFSLFPENIMTDTTKLIYFGTVSYDIDNYKYTLASSEFNWKTSNPETGVMDTAGYFHGKKEGTVLVIASYGDLADTSFVTVEIGSGIKQLDIMDNSAEWLLSGSEVDLGEIKLTADNTTVTAGDSSFRISYRYTAESGKLNYLYLDPAIEIPVYGVPEFMYIDAKSDSIKHRLYYIFADDNGELFRVNATKYAERKYTFDTIPCPLKTFTALEPKQNFYYPIKLKRIEIQLGGIKTSGTVNTGTIYLDNLRVKYPASVPTIVENDVKPAGSFNLQQNYPNPFNPITVISFSIPEGSNHVQLKVFDILGREVVVLVNQVMSAGMHQVQWNASDFPSGVYICRIETGSYTAVKKMMLLK